MTIERNKVHHANILKGLPMIPNKSVHCIVTSPPYWGVRDYGEKGQIGMEKSPQAYVRHMLKVAAEWWRILRDDGTLFLNLGDCYADKKQGKLKPKDLVGIPWMVAFALQKQGWYLRSDIIWSKPNPMPESVSDRPTRAHEYIFLLTKSPKYYYDAEAIRTRLAESSVERLSQDIENQKGSNRVPGKTNGPMKAVCGGVKEDKQRGHSRRHAGFNDRWDDMSKEEQQINGANKKSVWTVSTKPFAGEHFATFPQDLIVDCIKAGTSEYGCCKDCGAPYVRDFTKQLLPTKKAAKTGVIDGRDMGADKQDQASNRQKDGHIPGHYNQITTKGWIKPCQCICVEIEPAIVCDTFFGAGTTGLVARKLNRDWVGADISQKYIDMANARLQKHLGLFL